MRFSIIVSVYNVEKYLTACLESILSQSYPDISDFEVIVVYDQGNDSSLSVIKEKEKLFKCKFTLIKNETRQGLGPSRNMGLNIAEGDYICFIDGDDWIDKDYLLKLKNIIEEKNCPDLIRLCYVRENSGFSENITTFKGNCSCDEIRRLVLEDELGSQSWLNVCKKELYDGIVFPNTFYEDMPVTFKLYYKACSITLFEYYGYHYIQRSDSLSYRPSPIKAYGGYLGFKEKLSFSKKQHLDSSTSVLLKKYTASSIYCLHGLASKPTRENKRLIKNIATEVLEENKTQKNSKIKGKIQLKVASIIPGIYSYFCRFAQAVRRQ